MEFRKILDLANRSLDSNTFSQVGTYTAESAISTAEALGGFVDTKDTVELVSALKPLKDIESKFMQESGITTVDSSTGNVLVDTSTASIEKAYKGRLTDIINTMGATFESINLESAQGSEIAQGIKTTMLVNLGRTNQDEFTEEFFPSILSPEINQLSYSYTIAAYVKEWKGNHKELLPIHETLVDTSFLQGNTLRLIPDYSSSNEYTNNNVKIVVKNGTREIESAPYKFGTKVDVIDACVDDVTVAGIKNNVRTISPTIKLDEIYFSNAGFNETAASKYGTADEVRFSFHVSRMEASSATPVHNGKREDFQIKFGKDKVFTVKLEDIIKGDGSALFAAYPNAEANFAIIVNTDGNLTKAQLSTDVISFKWLSFRVNNKVEKSGSVFEAIMGIVKEVVPVGYTLQTFEANGDVVNEGNVITTDNDIRVFPIGYKQPLTVHGPIANLYNQKNDVSMLAEFITHLGDKSSVDGRTLLLDTIQAIKLSPNAAEAIDGIGNKLIKPVVIESAVNIATQIKNMETSNLEASVQALLQNVIKTTITRMFVESNYKAIFNRFYKNRAMRVSVGIDQRLETWLPTGKYEITPGIEVYVVSTVDNRFRDKMVLAFTSSEAERNTTIDILGLGFNAYDTTIVTQVNKSIGGAVNKHTMAFPKYEHIVMCSVLGEVTVSGIDEVFIG